MLYSGFCHASKTQRENKRKQNKRKKLKPCQRTKKAVEHEDDGDTNCGWCSWDSPQRLGRKIGGIGNQKKN